MFKCLHDSSVRFFRTSVVLLCVCCSPAVAQNKIDYFEMGGRAVAAFECSLLAHNNEADAKRLFDSGYVQGKKFVDALLEKKIDLSDRSPMKTVPGVPHPGLFMLVFGSSFAEHYRLSADFGLGFAYAGLFDQVNDDVEKLAGKYASDEIRQATRDRLYSSKNCNSLG